MPGRLVLPGKLVEPSRTYDDRVSAPEYVQHGESV
jgi:hypothetical protein